MLSKQKETFTNDFLCGSAAGATTGVIIAWLEVIKVNLQLKKFSSMTLTQKLKHTFLESFKTTPQFAACFGGACAAEFSVNTRIKHYFGDYPALFASAFTGAFFLTPAEHLMLVSARLNININNAFKFATKNSFSNLWTGMTSMLIRESFFMFNLFLAGQNLGKKLQAKFGDLNDATSDEKWKAIGRLTCGVLTTTLSHPFDTVARMMQVTKMNNPHSKVKMLDMFKKTSFKDLYLGLAPRLVFANIGGTMAAYLFEHFKKQNY